MNEFCVQNKINNQDALESVVQNLVDQGILASIEGNHVEIQGNQFDVKGKIQATTTELVRRTKELHKNLTSQSKTWFSCIYATYMILN